MDIDFLKFISEDEEEEIPRIEMRKMTIVPLVILFVFLNFIMATILNLHFMAQKTSSDYFFSVDLRPNIVQEEKEKIEKKILELYGVKNVKYISKENAFKELQEQLGVALPNAENTLPDSMIVYFRTRGDIPALQSKFEEMEEIKEIYIDNINIQFKEDRAKFYKLLEVVLFGAVFVPLIISIIFVFYNGCSLEFINKYDLIVNEKDNRSKAKWANVPNLLTAATIGTLITMNGYLWLREFLITNIGGSYTLLSFKELLLPEVIVVAAICAILCVLPYWPIKSSVGEEQ